MGIAVIVTHDGTIARVLAECGGEVEAPAAVRMDKPLPMKRHFIENGDVYIDQELLESQRRVFCRPRPAAYARPQRLMRA